MYFNFNHIAKLLFSGINLINAYVVSDLIYETNDINFVISRCPNNIDCTTLIFNAIYVCNVPGSYRNFNLEFYNNEIHDENNNNIIFDFFENGHGKTVFTVDSYSNIIKKVDVYINPYGLDFITLYNVVLHEIAHVMLLEHSKQPNSIMEYKIILDKNNNIINNNKRLNLTKDDCYGIYMKLIYDILFTNYLYALKLNTAMINNCNELPDNKINRIDTLSYYREMNSNTENTIEDDHKFIKDNDDNLSRML